MKEIILTQNKVAIVDDEDFERVNKFKWYAHKQKRGGWRAVRTVSKGKFLPMHRFILGTIDPTILIDHKDHDGLNNQKANLRFCTKQQNNFNKLPHKNSSSKYLGVCFENFTKRWLATITHNRRQIKLGRHKSEIEAARAYNSKAKELFGEFANLNNV